MNKDVIYIEPEEDITDVITKIKAAKTKIVALVPPKKSGVFRSIVNIKLIAKAAGNTKKAVVLVTTDPSIIKLAAATEIPVTKDLNTAPAVPELDDDIDETEVVDVEDDAEEVSHAAKARKEDKESADEDDAEDNSEDEDDAVDDEESDEDSDEEDSQGDSDDDVEDDDSYEGEKKPSKKDSKRAQKEAKKASRKDRDGKGFFGKLAQSDNKFLHFIGTHPKITIGSGVGCVLLIIFAIWAFAIAPAVTITLDLETTTGNFSESISFTEKLADEKVSSGVFYITEQKIENKSEVEFEATGKKNVGEKAKGSLTVYYRFTDKKSGTFTVNAGSTFTYSNLSYVSTDAVTISWGGKDSECKNKDDDNIGTEGCYIYKDIPVQAVDSGANYNISATGTGWVTSAGVTVSSGSAMSGGSDKTVTIVQQSDVDEAMKKITTENESANKEKLYSNLSDDMFPIDSSFKQTTSDPVVSPAVGEEVADGKKAKLTVTTTDAMFVLDETKLKEYITEKAKLASGYKIYEMNAPFIENFTKTDSGYIGKLKTSYVAGSTITENEVVDTVKGKGIGTAKRDLSDNFSGIKTITIDTSVPWVTSVPNNTEKITVKINVKE